MFRSARMWVVQPNVNLPTVTYQRTGDVALCWLGRCRHPRHDKVNRTQVLALIEIAHRARY